MTEPQYDIAIICDGDSSYGYGHIRRSQTIFQHLAEQHINAAIFALSDTGKSLLKPSSKTLPDAKVYLIDTPYAIDELTNALLAKNCQIVGLDYQGKVALSFAIYTFIHPQQNISAPYSSGFEYCIIRQEFKKLSRQEARSNKHVLVTIGGADINNQGIEISNYLRQLGAEVQLVLGPLADTEQGKAIDTNVTVIRSPENFPELLNSCDWLVCNGGGTLFEARFLRKPSFVIPQTDAEYRVAQALATKNELLGLGIEALMQQSELFTVAQLQTTKDSCIDGLGVTRIQDKLLEFLCQKNG